MNVVERVATYGRLVRFSHTVFALPFAVMGALVAAGGLPAPRTLLLILLAMVGARSAAMAMNRLADHSIDAANPRTAGRELPSGRLERAEVWAFLALSAGLFVLAAGLLNRLALLLSPVVLAVLLSYPFAKRFTALCHLWLGTALGLSPVGAFVAVRGDFGEGFPAVVALGSAVVFWTAGFDVIYALLDLDHDRKSGIFSLPAKFGARRALALSAAFHVAATGLLAAAGVLGGLGAAWYAGVAAAAVLLAFEHFLVRPSDLSRLSTAFFTVNAVLSIALLGFLVVDLLARR